MPEVKSKIKFEEELTIQETTIPGLLVINLSIHGDSRGWFKENWQNEKMIKLGLPKFYPIQNNISFNANKGVTRGIHAEPWDKYISLGYGKIFGAWVDLRQGKSFGKVFTIELDPSKAVYVPRGVGNAFQALQDNTVYTYLVNDHWSAEAGSQYTFLNLADKSININWPITLSKSEISEKDKNHPNLSEVKPMEPKKTLIIGSNGQLGRALQLEFPDAECVDINSFDISDPNIYYARNWRQYELILNAAAYTAVDLAETHEGMINAWKSNAKALSYLAKISKDFGVTLVHISSDYVFNGEKTEHLEDEPYSPINTYGQSKAAGDIAVSTTDKYYIIRTSWVVGDGKNFILTMKSLSEKGIKPTVVNDQIGRLTFTSELARGIKHLVNTNAKFGIYNITGDGKSASWADIASLVYELLGKGKNCITGVSTKEYYANKDNIANRPLQSTLNLDKIKATGFIPQDWRESLKNYLIN